jgi:hypothetical protein
VCALWSPAQHAAGFSSREPAALLFAAGSVKLVRRLRRSRAAASTADDFANLECGSW